MSEIFEALGIIKTVPDPDEAMTQNSDGVPVGEIITQLQDALNLAKGSGYERSSIGNDALAALLAHIAAERERMVAVVERCAKVADWHDTMPHIPGACGADIRAIAAQGD